MITVVAPTHNRIEKLARLLSSLEYQEEAPAEVIVVDDASTDGTGRFVTEWMSKKHRFIEKAILFPTNRGPAAARNAGWRAASGEIVLFTDDDCVAGREWVAQLARKLRSDPSLGGVGGRVFPLGNDLYSRYYTHYRILEPPPSVLYLVTANCAFRKTALDNVGGFDERLDAPGGEDVDLSVRVRSAGWQLAFVPTATIFHDYRRGLRDFFKTFRAYGRGCGAIARRSLQGAAA